MFNNLLKSIFSFFAFSLPIIGEEIEIANEKNKTFQIGLETQFYPALTTKIKKGILYSKELILGISLVVDPLYA